MAEIKRRVLLQCVQSMWVIYFIEIEWW
jgi:hypothetical protein